MELTRPFVESIKERAARDPELRSAMLAEATERFLAGEPDVARIMLRDYVNATIGFQTLGDEVQKDPKSLMRMLSDKGNPYANNLSEILAALSRHEGVSFGVQVSR